MEPPVTQLYSVRLPVKVVVKRPACPVMGTAREAVLCTPTSSTGNPQQGCRGGAPSIAQTSPSVARWMVWVSLLLIPGFCPDPLPSLCVPLRLTPCPAQSQLLPVQSGTLQICIPLFTAQRRWASHLSKRQGPLDGPFFRIPGRVIRALLPSFLWKYSNHTKSRVSVRAQGTQGLAGHGLGSWSKSSTL